MLILFEGELQELCSVVVDSCFEGIRCFIPSMLAGCVLVLSLSLFLSTKGIHTLMGDLEDRPQHLVLLLALVRGVLGVLHLVLKLEERVLQVLEAIWGCLLGGACCADWRHGGIVAG